MYGEMAKRKYPSELNSRTVRVNIGDWHLLMELARQHDTTVAEILHLAITGKAKEEHKRQIAMPVFKAVAPVSLQVRPQPTIAVNGNKAGVFVIKPKGGTIND